MTWTSACFLPARHARDGHACDSDSECELPRLACVAGACAPPNLLPNGSFELGLGTQEWLPNGTSTLLESSGVHARTGTRSARAIESGTGDDNLLGVKLDSHVLRPVQSGGAYCLEAWVWVEVFRPGGRVQLFASRYSETDREDVEGTFTELEAPGWQRLTAQAATPGGWDTALGLKITFKVIPRLAPGEAFFVDDVRVWRATPGTCFLE